MTLPLKILLGLLTLLWGLLSLAYWGETVGFYFMQLLFIPLISGILLFRQNKKIGTSVLAILFVMVYGLMNGPYRNIVACLPFALLLWFFVGFSIKSPTIVDRLFGITLSILCVLKIVNLLPIENNPIILPFAATLVVVPFYIGYLTVKEQTNQDIERTMLITSTILTTLNVVLYNLNFFHILELNPILLFFLTMFSLASLVGLFITLKPKRDIILALLTFMVFTYFAIWTAENMTKNVG